MEVIIAGDSRNCPDTLQALEACYDKAELYLHTGDAGRTSKQWIIVKGVQEKIPYANALTIQVLGHKIYLAGGKAVSIHTLLQRAKTLGCDIVIWGQVHVAWCVELDGILFINPGSLFHASNSMPPSFARLELHVHKDPVCTICYKPDWTFATSRKADSRLLPCRLP